MASDNMHLPDGYYTVAGSPLGHIGFIKVKGGTVWGYSYWRGEWGYRTLGIPVQVWLQRLQDVDIWQSHHCDRSKCLPPECDPVYLHIPADGGDCGGER